MTEFYSKQGKLNTDICQVSCKICLNSLFYLFYLLYFCLVTLKSLVPDISWEFTNMQNGKVLAKEKADNNDDTSVVTSRNFGDLLQGTTTAWDEPLKTQVAYFNGTSSGVLIPTLTGLCVLRPSTCLDGFSVAFWIKRVEWKSYFIFTSSSFGMKELVQDTAAVEVVDAENQKTWRVFVTIDTSNWQFFTMTWSQEDGITVYIDGVFKLNETNTVPTTYLATVNLAVAGDRLAFGTSVEDTRDEANVQMYFNKFMIWEHRLNTTEVEQVYQNGMWYFFVSL